MHIKALYIININAKKVLFDEINTPLD